MRGLESVSRVRKTAVAIMVGLVVLLGSTACGSGAGAASAVVPASTHIDPGDQTRAAGAALARDDFPAAFRQESATSGSDSSCIDGSGLTITGSAKSDMFIRDDASYAMFAQSRTVVLDGEDEARAYFAKSQQSGVFDCVAKRVASGEANSSGVVWKFADWDRIPGPRAGDQAFTARLRFTVTANGEADVLVDDVTFVRVRDAVSVIQLFDFGEPFDQTSAVFDGPTSDDLVQAVAGRMQSS
jgi:hypothetical protein